MYSTYSRYIPGAGVVLFLGTWEGMEVSFYFQILQKANHNRTKLNNSIIDSAILPATESQGMQPYSEKYPILSPQVATNLL